MPIKPLSHLRPLLRLPSHSSPGPEHFSSNPSLLHHLPQNPAHSLVSTSHASAAAGSANAGASGAGGRAGWGAGTGSGSGYTGHARAFLSLPHTSVLDPSTSLSLNDEGAAQRKGSHSLIFKHRLAQHAQIVNIESDAAVSGRRVHRQIESRSGGRSLDIVDVEPVTGQAKLAIEDGSAPRGRRRSSIAFPQPQQRLHASPTPSRVSSPHPARTISRSQSSLEVWQAGLPQENQRISVRTMSTVSKPAEGSTDSERLVTRTPPRSSRVISQPNRVLMDLAGLDLPGRPAPARLVRRNSTAAIQQTEEQEQESEDAEASEQAADDRDRSIYLAILKAYRRRPRDDAEVREIIAHYRSPRTPDAFAEPQSKRLKNLPLPEGYTTATYNIALEALHALRRPGETIAPVLELYNEMLDRDCIPNGKTYSTVIEALCDREMDVWTAVRAWEEEKKWAAWKDQNLGVQQDARLEAEKDAIIQGYKDEGNFSSALKLFRATFLMKGQKYRLHSPACRKLVHAAGARDNTVEEVDEVLQVCKLGLTQRMSGNRGWKAHFYLALGNVKDADQLTQEWDRFVAEDLEGQHQTVFNFIERRDDVNEEEAASVIRLARKAVWRDAAIGFARAGAVDKGFEIIEQMKASTGKEGEAPQASVNDIFAFAYEVAQLDAARAFDLLDTINPKQLSGFNAKRYSDLFVYSADAPRFIKFAQKFRFEAESNSNDLVAKILIRAIGIARTPGDPAELDKALGVISSISDSAVRLSFDFDIFRAHTELLLQQGKVDELYTTLKPYSLANSMSFTEGEITQLVRPIVDSVVSEVQIPFKALLKYIQRAQMLVDFSDDEVIPVILGRAYVDIRAKASPEEKLQLTLPQWDLLIRTTIGYPTDDAELDATLVQLSTDLSSLKQEESDSLNSFNNGEILRLFTARVVQRLGRERASSLLTGLLGEHRAKSWIDAPASTPELTQADTASEPSYPPTPEPVQPPPGVPAVLAISPGLGARIDNHTSRKANITPQGAYQLLKKQVQQHGLVAHPDYIARLLDNLARTGFEPAARELYDLAHYVSQTLLPAEDQAAAWQNIENAMLIGCCHMGYLEEAGMYRARLLDSGMVPSADSYATMIASSKDTTDDALVARELFDESRAFGVIPNLFLYNTIISKLSKARKADLALDLFKAMKESRVRPSSVTYGAVINACCRVGDGESAAVLFNEMTSQPDFRPRVPPYNTMMQFHLTTQPSRERVLYYFECMRAAGVPPSAHTYKLLLDANAVLPPVNLEGMERVFAQLCKDQHVKVQGTHWASLISAYGIYADDLEKALATFDSIPTHRIARVDISTEPVVWEAILNVVATKGTIEQLEAVRSRMIASGVRPTAYVYNVLIGGYTRADMIEKAREVFESMGDSVTGVAAPNNHPTLLTSSGHVKPSTVTDIPTGVVYREPSTYEAMIRAEMAVGDRKRAAEVLKRMEERRYPVAVYLRARALLDEPVGRIMTPDESHVPQVASGVYDPTTGSGGVLERKLAEEPVESEKVLAQA